MSGLIYSLLKNDTALAGKGVGNVFMTNRMEGLPRDSLSIIVVVGSQSVQGALRTGPVNYTVWVHQPVEWKGTDYTVISQVLQRIKEILHSVEGEVGEDGIRVVECACTGDGGYLEDKGFNTITRNSGYRVQLHMV